MGNQGPLRAVCWGELLWDLFPSGACLGGAPSNVAMHLAASGVSTSLITRLGSDKLGDQAQEALRAFGVETSSVQRHPSLPTGRVGIEIRAQEASYTLHPGAWQEIEVDAAAPEKLRQCGAFCFGTLSQESEHGLASWRSALQWLPTEALRVCDPNLRGGRIDSALVHEHLAAANVVKINDEEAEVLCATYSCSDAVSWLLDEMDVPIVAQTHGAQGATIRTQKQCVAHSGFPAGAGGDNVGAGDSFVAILVLGLLSGHELERIVEAANFYGSFVASNLGATPIAPPQVRDRITELLVSDVMTSD